MPEKKVIDEEIITAVGNTDENSHHVICRYQSIIINNAPVINSPIFIDLDQDTEYNFDPAIILNNYTDVEDNQPLQFKIIETVNIGDIKLGAGGIKISNNQVIDWTNFSDLKWKPPAGKFGSSYASIKLVVKDDGEIPRLYSNVVELVFNIVPENREPSVSDSTLKINYGQLVPLTADLFTKDYYDPETNSLGSISITNLPPAGEGRVILDGSIITNAQLPLSVTASQLINNLLQYEDTGEIISGKSINIGFQVFDNVN